MTPDYEICNPLKDPDWDAKVKAFPEGSGFHSLQWTRVLQDSYGYIPCYLVFGDRDAPAAIIPMMEIRSFLTGIRGVSLPFSDNCPPLLNGSADRKKVIDAIFSYGRSAGWKEVEFRGGDLLVDTLSPSTWYYRHRLSLQHDSDSLFATLRHSTRNNVRKAQKSGVVITKGRESEDMEKFYKLNVQTRKKHGLPPQPLSFFRKFHEHIIAPGQGSIVTAHYNGQCISGVICMEFGDTVILKYAAAAVDSLGVRPNNLLIWELIQRYRDEKFQTIDFGRTDPQNEGLRRFKNSWNVEETVFSYFKFDLEKNTSVAQHLYSTDIASAVFRVMPGPLLRLVGKVLYRHIG